MASEKRCDASNFLIAGVDAGEGPMILKSGDYTFRVEVIAWPADDSNGDEIERPNLRWGAVRKMIEQHTDDPIVEGDDDDEGVLDLAARKAESA